MRIVFFNFILWLAALRLVQFPAAAQTPAAMMPEQLMRSQPSVDLSVPVTATAAFDPPLVRPGEKSIYRVTLNATEVSVQRPEQIIAPPQLKLGASVSGQNMQPAGGAFQMFSTFNYDARATEPGLFTVPPFTVEVYGQRVVVPAAQLEVKAELPGPHEPVRELLLTTSATNVFVGEPFDVSVRLPAASANGVEVVAQTQINGEGFITDKSTTRQSIQSVEMNGVRTATFIYETSILPISAGPLQLSAQGFTSGLQFAGPITISGRVTIPGGPPKYQLLESDPLTITVRPLPPEGELPGFTGAVGSYSCGPPILMTNILKVGEPVELTVNVHGRQSLNRISPSPPPRVPGWQIFPAVRGAMAAANSQDTSFQYTLIPLSADVRTTPAIPFSSFDPARGRYVDLTIRPVPVTVIADAALTNADTALMLSGNASEPEKKAGLSRLAQTPGYTTGSLAPLQMRGWFPLVQLVPPLGFCGLWFWDRRRRFLEQHPEIVRRRRARHELHRELRQLEKSAATGDDAGFIRSATHALQIACAPHYPATPRALVCGDVLQILAATENDDTSGETVRRFFAATDAAAFAVTPGNNSGLLAEKPALKEILAKLEARL